LPARVDNDCKDILDKLVLQLQGTTTGKLVVVGSASAANLGKNPTLGAQRAQNAEYYLTTAGSTKVDADRVETRQGDSDEDIVRFYYLPAGELCSGHNELGNKFDESAVNAASCRRKRSRRRSRKMSTDFLLGTPFKRSLSGVCRQTIGNPGSHFSLLCWPVLP
jgi:hypothetical protein